MVGATSQAEQSASGPMIAVDANKNVEIVTSTYNGDNVQHFNMLKNLVLLSLGALVCAFIYVIFPCLDSNGDTNFWLFYIAKETWWTAFGLSAIIELFDACLPGAPDVMYVYLYVTALTLRAVIHIMALLIAGDMNAPSLVYTAASAPRVLIFLVYAGWIYGYKQATLPPAPPLSPTLTAPIPTAFEPSKTNGSRNNNIIDNPSSNASRRSTFHIITSNLEAEAEAGAKIKTKTVARADTVASGEGSAAIIADAEITSTFNPVHSTNSNSVMISATVSVDFDLENGIRLVHSNSFINTRSHGDPSYVFDESNSSSTNNSSSSSSSCVTTPTASVDGHNQPGSDFGSVDYFATDKTRKLTPAASFGSGWLYAFPQFVARNKLLPRYLLNFPEHSRVLLLSAPTPTPTDKAEGSDTKSARTTTTVTGDRTSYAFRQYGTLVLFVLLLVVVGNTLEALSVSFRTNTTQQRKFGIFVVYTFACILYKIMVKRIGLLLDARKIGGLSMFFLAEFLGVIFYFSYYRMLFEHAVDWRLFAIMQLFHFACEWLMYGLRFTKCVYACVSTTDDADLSSPGHNSSSDVTAECSVTTSRPAATTAKVATNGLPDDGCIPLRTMLVLPGLTYFEWQSCLLFEFCTRVFAAIFSAVGYCVLLIATARFWWIESELKPITTAELRVPFFQLLTCVCLEGINAYVMYFIVRSSFVASGWAFLRLIANRRFCLLCFLYGVCALINPFAGFQTYLDNMMTI